MTKKEDKTLAATVPEILAAEYDYIAQTAFQANEDRARVTTFYVVSVGSLMGALLGTSQETEKITLWAFAGLFFFLSSFGILTLLQLARLRKAWFSSAAAMNCIKEFVIEKNESLELEGAFLWRAASLPTPYKKNSVAYLMALQVSMLGAVTFGAMAFYTIAALQKAIPETTSPLFIAALLGILFLLAQMWLYRKELPPKKYPCPQTSLPVE